MKVGLSGLSTSDSSGCLAPQQHPASSSISVSSDPQQGSTFSLPQQAVHLHIHIYYFPKHSTSAHNF